MSPTVHDQLRIDAAMVRDILVRFLREETSRIGISNVVIGLSGGIDSALSAFLSTLAFGAEHVTCVMMPYRTSSPESLTDARAVIRQLGVQHEIVEITPMVEPLFEKLAIADPVRRGNIMARERMIVLYDISMRETALVTQPCLATAHVR
jgi:NAD+ synthase